MYFLLAPHPHAQLRREGGYLARELPASDITVLGGPPLPEGARVTAFLLRPESVRQPSIKARWE